MAITTVSHELHLSLIKWHMSLFTNQFVDSVRNDKKIRTRGNSSQTQDIYFN